MGRGRGSAAQYPRADTSWRAVGDQREGGGAWNRARGRGRGRGRGSTSRCSGWGGGRNLRRGTCRLLGFAWARTPRGWVTTAWVLPTSCSLASTITIPVVTSPSTTAWMHRWWWVLCRTRHRYRHRPRWRRGRYAGVGVRRHTRRVLRCTVTNCQPRGRHSRPLLLQEPDLSPSPSPGPGPRIHHWGI